MDTLLLKIINDYGLVGLVVAFVLAGIAYIIKKGELTFRYPRSDKMDR